MPQKKKLSLEEARAMFAEPKKDSRQHSRSNNGISNKQVPDSKSKDPALIQQQITRLERKIEFDNLSPEQEQKIMEEIGRLEEQLKQSSSA